MSETPPVLPLPMVTASWRDMNRLVKAEVAPFPYVPVRTSAGLPRFAPWAGSCPNVGLLTPYGLLTQGYSDQEFEIAYRRRIDNYGLDRIEAFLRGIHQEFEFVPLAIMCFENVHEGEFCHRRIFAKWWQEQTGYEVPEMDPVPAANERSRDE